MNYELCRNKKEKKRKNISDIDISFHNAFDNRKQKPEHECGKKKGKKRRKWKANTREKQMLLNK